jgi:D-sedoheptulose 7-phosphate isomerase
MTIDHIRDNLVEACYELDRLISDDTQLVNIQADATVLIDALSYLAGSEDRIAMVAVAISDPSYNRCVANDYGYEQVFARFVEGNGTAGDALFAFSTIASSRSVVLAAQAAHARGMMVVGLTGRQGSQLERVVDVCICTSAETFDNRV